MHNLAKRLLHLSSCILGVSHHLQNVCNHQALWHESAGLPSANSLTFSTKVSLPSQHVANGFVCCVPALQGYDCNIAITDLTRVADGYVMQPNQAATALTFRLFW